MVKKWEFKMLFVTIIALLWTLSISVPSYAKGAGKGETHGTTEGDMPPGLARENKMPYGLEKQDKTPAGWSKGKKKGWKKRINKKEKKENPEAEKHKKAKE